jgi:hypothetical protein
LKAPEIGYKNWLVLLQLLGIDSGKFMGHIRWTSLPAKFTAMDRENF